VTAVLVVLSCLVYAAGLVLLGVRGRRSLAIALAAIGGLGLAITTLP
jgi:hypothetical protein